MDLIRITDTGLVISEAVLEYSTLDEIKELRQICKQIFNRYNAEKKA